MRVSLRWLEDYLDLPTRDPAELAHVFDMLGHAVEEIEHFTADWTDGLCDQPIHPCIYISCVMVFRN